jgi:hypothetical protein
VADEPAAAPAAAAPAAAAAEGDTPAAELKPAADAANWRDKIAGEDKEFRKRLERFADESAFAKSYRALEQKLSSGEYKKTNPFPTDGTDAEKAEWRKEAGVPGKPEDYGEPKLPNGIVFAEKDKAAVAFFDQWMHKNNYTPDQRNGLLAAYGELADAQISQRQDADAAFKQKVEDALRAEWQGDYRRNLNAIGSLQAQMPDTLGASLVQSRMPDGTVLGNHPGFLKWFAQLALDLDPSATVVPAGGGSHGASVETRLAEFRTMRQNDPDGWDRNTVAQDEELRLLDAQQKMQARGSKAA